MYFGFQTYLRNPRIGLQGKGLIFSRWNSSDKADCAPAPGGWCDKGEENGKYVGVRSLFDWKLGRYLCWLRPTQEEMNARWYEFCLRCLADGREATVGSLRFQNPGQQKAQIHSGGGSWTEVYSGVTIAEDVPLTQVIVHSIAANNNSMRPVRCDTTYNPNFPCADCFVSSSGILHLNSGKGVSLIHPKQSYVISTYQRMQRTAYSRC